jgi:hypothetical protein
VFVLGKQIPFRKPETSNVITEVSNMRRRSNQNDFKGDFIACRMKANILFYENIMMRSSISARRKLISKFSVKQHVQIKLQIHYRKAGAPFRASSTVKQNCQHYKFIKLTDETVDICNFRVFYGDYKRREISFVS